MTAFTARVKSSRRPSREQKVLITGISGFVGGHLARFLLSRGCKVIGTFHQTKPQLPAEINVFQADLRNSVSIRRLLSRSKPDIVFHLAALSIPSLSWQNPALTIAVNAGGTVSLLRAMNKIIPRARLVFISSNLVYGRGMRSTKKITEQTPLQPESPYAYSKALAELACRHYHKKSNVDVVVARPFNHIGPGQSNKMVFSDWCRQVAQAEKNPGKAFLKVGNLDAYRDILNVSDVVSAYWLLSQKGKAGEAYNICSSKAVRLESLASSLLSNTKKEIRLRIEKSRMRRSDPSYIRGDNRMLRRLGWKPESSSRKALKQMLDYWRSVE